MADRIARREPNSAMCYFACTLDSSLNTGYVFEGRDCVINVIEQATVLAKLCIDEMRKSQDTQLTDADMKKLYKAKTRYICGAGFRASDKKVRDRCHRTGCYRGAARTSCEFNHFLNRYLPIAFRNLRGDDSRVILQEAFEGIGYNEGRTYRRKLS